MYYKRLVTSLFRLTRNSWKKVKRCWNCKDNALILWKNSAKGIVKKTNLISAEINYYSAISMSTFSKNITNRWCLSLISEYVWNTCWLWLRIIRIRRNFRFYWTNWTLRCWFPLWSIFWWLISSRNHRSRRKKVRNRLEKKNMKCRWTRLMIIWILGSIFSFF